MKEERINLKSDVSAKQAFADLLREKGYSEVKIVSSPADIIATKDGLQHYFEIKFTNKKDSYFGAATLTEWNSAINNPDRFMFIIARKEAESWIFVEYTPKEFARFNTIPPFKTYFNIALKNKKSEKQSEPPNRSRAAGLRHDDVKTRLILVD